MKLYFWRLEGGYVFMVFISRDGKLMFDLSRLLLLSFNLALLTNFIFGWHHPSISSDKLGLEALIAIRSFIQMEYLTMILCIMLQYHSPYGISLIIIHNGMIRCSQFGFQWNPSSLRLMKQVSSSSFLGNNSGWEVLQSREISLRINSLKIMVHKKDVQKPNLQ